jgi:PBP1b-binding outer membrane lipoprotein LpoB
MRKILLLGLVVFISACSNKYQNVEEIKVTIAHEIPYENPQEVAENIKTECFDLEMNLSKFISLHGKSFNIDVVRSHDFNKIKEGLVFDLKNKQRI